MGSQLSKEQTFVKDLKHNFKKRGIRVKKKDLLRFFIFIDKVYPWFIINGPEIHPGKWQKVGRDLNDKLKQEGPESVPINVFSFWTLINEIIEEATGDKNTRQLLVQAESCLAPLSRAASVSSFHTEGIGDKEEAKPPPSTENKGEVKSPPPIRSIYPPLPTNTLTFPVFPTEHKNPLKADSPNKDGVLPDDEAADLEAEAAAYNPQEAFITQPCTPPPYVFPPAMDLSLIQKDLTGRMIELRKTLDIQNQYQQMIREFSTLQASLQKSLLSTPMTTSSMTTPPPNTSRPLKKSKALLFPILRNKSKTLPKDPGDSDENRQGSKGDGGGNEGSEEDSQEEEGDNGERDSDSGEQDLDSEEDTKFSASPRYKAHELKSRQGILCKA